VVFRFSFPDGLCFSSIPFKALFLFRLRFLFFVFLLLAPLLPFLLFLNPSCFALPFLRCLRLLLSASFLFPHHSIVTRHRAEATNARHGRG